MKQAKDVISSTYFMTLATCDKDAQPWNTPLYFAFDENYSFYWVSWKENQHSRNVRANSKVFIVIYDTHVLPDKGETSGVYIQAKAQELNDEEEIKKALTLIHNRGSITKIIPERFMNDFPRRAYKAVLEKCWTNTSDRINGRYVDKRIEINLINA